MTTETLSFPYTGAETKYGGQGRIWYIKQASAPLNIVCRKSGQGSTNVRAFTAMPAGAKFRAEIGDGWDTIEITSGVAQNVVMILGDDDVEIASAVTVTGSVVTQEQPATAFVPRAPLVTVAGQQALFPVNAARKRITVTSRSTNSAVVTLRTAGDANDVQELQPGTGFTWSNIDALDVVSVAGGETLLILEEV